jgi:non-specific serine/threonine protein kinase
MAVMERPAFSYRFGSTEFDEARFELKVAGLPVEVERRALEVLALLLRHAGEVVTKGELLTEVWAGRVTVENVLPNAVNKLRRALGEANAAHIVTVPRVGYRLDGPVSRTAVGRQPAGVLELVAGQAVAGRPNFALVRPLGRSPGGEVWLAEHSKTSERRVYKFALDADRLRALKREATLLRLLHDSLSDSRHVVELLDWNFEQAPYFLECGWGGITLDDWAAAHLGRLARPARIAVFLQIAEAVAQAHAVGVLHKDLKPANVLVAGDADAPHVRLSDFGSGHLLDPDRLERLGITRMGMTVDEAAGPGWPTGTPLYVAPEHFEGQAPSTKSDVYALGVLLYQLLSDRVGLPMASGWEAQIDDELLRDDLRLATEGDRTKRLASAAELVDRLRHLEERRAALLEQRRELEAARRDREALARTQARRPFVWAAVGSLVLGAVLALVLQRQAVQARNQARAELDRAGALASFLNEDLIGRANPLVSAKGPDATLREVLLSTRGRVAERFGTQPLTAATLHGSLAALFGAIDLFADAETEALKALALLQQHGDASGPEAMRATAVLVRVLSRLSRFDDAQRHLADLERAATAVPQDAAAQQRLHAARSAYLIARGEMPQAVEALRAAIRGLDAADPHQRAERDALRVDLIATLALAQQPEPARAEGQTLIAELQSRPGDPELSIALARMALARAHGEDHAAAEQLLLQAKPVIAARLGESHSRHITVLAELLGVAYRRADWPRAIAYAQQVHSVARGKYGEAHVSTQVTRVNWARALVESGEAAAARDKARVGYERLLELVGPDSPRTQDAGFLLALIALDMGDTSAAEGLLARLDAKVLESGRPSGLWAAGLQALQGVALLQRGKAEAARPLLDSALAALEDEQTLAQPSRMYVLTRAARARIRG